MTGPIYDTVAMRPMGVSILRGLPNSVPAHKGMRKQ
jgi:hypothetical protein